VYKIKHISVHNETLGCDNRLRLLTMYIYVNMITCTLSDDDKFTAYVQSQRVLKASTENMLNRRYNESCATRSNLGANKLKILPTIYNGLMIKNLSHTHADARTAVQGTDVVTK